MRNTRAAGNDTDSALVCEKSKLIEQNKKRENKSYDDCEEERAHSMFSKFQRSTFHDMFAHGAVLTLVLFSAFFAFMCAGFVSRSHYIRAKENALVHAMNADLLEDTADREFSAMMKRDKDGKVVANRTRSNGKSFARTILTKAELTPFEKWLAKDGEIPLDRLVEALREDRNVMYRDSEGLLGKREYLRGDETQKSDKEWAHAPSMSVTASSTTMTTNEVATNNEQPISNNNNDNDKKHKFTLCLDDMNNWDVRLGAGAWMDDLFQSKPEGKNSAGECFTNVVYDSGPECANADVRVFESGSVLWKGSYVSKSSIDASSAATGEVAATATVAVTTSKTHTAVALGNERVLVENNKKKQKKGLGKFLAKLGFFDNDILGPDSTDILIDSKEKEVQEDTDPLVFTDEAIYEDEMGFLQSESNKRRRLRRSLLEKSSPSSLTSSSSSLKKQKKSTSDKKLMNEQKSLKTTATESSLPQQTQQQQQPKTLWKLPEKKNPNQVYVYASLETPGAFGKDLMNENLLSQVDYIAHSNEKASSLWLPQMISTRGLMASYEAFSRPKNTRIPGVAWLGKNCPDNAPKLKVLKEVSNHFPVFSIGDCRRNTATPLGLPEHKLMGSGGIDFFTKTQLALSDYLFYFVGEDADCPGAIHADLWMALARGSIPVYFGTANVYEYLPCPDGDCIIDVKKFDSSKHLAKELRKISSSQKLYKKATEWRRQHPDEWPEGFKRGLARASQDFRKTLCDSVLQNGGDQFDKGVTKEDVIKRTIMSVPWSDVASSSSSSSSSQENSDQQPLSTTTETKAPLLQGALRAEAFAEKGDVRASSVACAKQNEVSALGSRVGDMQGFDMNDNSFKDPTEFIKIDVKTQRELDMEQRENDEDDDSEDDDVDE